jgi:hypothetical protein
MNLELYSNLYLIILYKVVSFFAIDRIYIISNYLHISYIYSIIHFNCLCNKPNGKLRILKARYPKFFHEFMNKRIRNLWDINN